MNNVSRTSAGTAVALSMLAFLGCSDPSLAPAKGKVLVEGKAAVSGRVVFRPVGGGKTALAEIQPDGSYEMTVEERTKGAQVGFNHVLVVDVTTQTSEEPGTYQCPDDQRVQVEPKTDNEFLLDVDPSEGWSKIEE